MLRIGAMIDIPVWPRCTCRPSSCHFRYEATQVGNGDETLPCSNNFAAE
jgi:hypothetical protein